MDKYNVIKEIREVEQFLKYIPTLKDGEVYFIALMARNKYTKEVDINDSVILHRNILKDKSHITKEMFKMEIPLGQYTFNDVSIPQESLVAYIKLNPRSVFKANMHSIKDSVNEMVNQLEAQNSIFDKINDLVDSGNVDIDSLKKVMSNKPKIIDNKKIIMSAFQESSSRRVYMDLDFDFKTNKINPKELLDYLIDHIGLDPVYGIIESRNGYHVQIDLSKIESKNRSKWFQNIINNPIDGVEIELNGDKFIPIPGATHGGKKPRLIYVNDGNEVLMTSDFHSLYDKDRVVLDPDGWDRKDYDWSYYGELISSETYHIRVMMSTVMVNKKEN